MTFTRYLRKVVFQCSQQELAAICKTTQATISRWERCEGEPSRQQLAALRTAAKRRRLEWQERWAFDHQLTRKQIEQLERTTKKRSTIEAAA